jgi:hypothetical protein
MYWPCRASYDGVSEGEGHVGVGEDFQAFCSNLAITNRSSISERNERITKRLNLEFWSSESNTSHSFYTGSFGRGTAIKGMSDVDMVFQLPYSEYEKYNGYVGNGQSALLQRVRTAVTKTYSETAIGADGQVVVIPFTDGITFELLPAFLNKDGSYTFPDSNEGGSWKTTNPKPEIDAIASTDSECNGNLKYLCRMMRAWKSNWSVPIGGLLIDTLAYQFIRGWQYREKSFLYYDFMTRDFLAYLATQDEKQTYWLSPGANQYVWRTENFEYKATRCRNISEEAIGHASKNETWAARQSWREIYGTAYPA